MLHALKKMFTKDPEVTTSINDVMISVCEKELRTLTQDRDNFVEMIHPNGYRSRHRVKLLMFNGNYFNPKVDCHPYWEYLKALAEPVLMAELGRVCISGHLYTVRTIKATDICH